MTNSDPIARLNAALAGRYRIERELGEGGMATVYLADDLKHERKVALKVLKPELAAIVGAERFLAEIKTTANLTHPHILPLFDSGEADGFVFYVMPWVEGESLRDRLDREHQLPVDDAVRIATNVAEALDYAHRHSVIHRDIKPANILLQDGKPVISDFGIALAMGTAGQGRLTETGLSVGTPHYMSPEQATGDRDVDGRSDIYSLGCVLYEMLTGAPPFQGKTAQSVLARILTEDVPLVTVARPTVPANVAAGVAKATERLPADRFASAAAFGAALDDPAFRHGNPVGAGASVGSSWIPGIKQSWSLLLAGVLGAAVVWSTRAGDDQTLPVLLTEVPVAVHPAAPILRAGDRGDLEGRQQGQEASYLTISGDGGTVAYVGEGGGIWLRTLQSLDVSPLPSGDPTAVSPEFSPNGQQLVYIRASGNRGELVRAGLSDVTPVPLNQVAYREASWGDDGFIYFEGPEAPGTISRVPENGGPSQTLLQPGDDHSWRYPEILPGGRTLLVTRWGPGPADDVVYTFDLETLELNPLVTAQRARYSRTGHLVYGDSNGTLLADRFDERRGELAGEPTVLAEGLHVRNPQFALSHRGDLVFLTQMTVGEDRETLLSVDREGAYTPVDPTRIDGDIETVAVSPSGRYLAIEYLEQGATGGADIWVYDLERSTFSPITRTDYDEQLPTWASDGETLLYFANPDDSYDVYSMPFDMSAEPHLVRSMNVDVYEAQESRDGRYLILKVIGQTTNRDILYIDQQGPDSVQVFLNSDAIETNPQLSPDGRWLAYMSDESGRDEVYVRRFPGGGSREQVSRDGGWNPAWSNAGDELFFVDRAVDSLVVVPVSEVDGRIEFGEPAALFDVLPFELSRWELRWTVMPGDEGFFFIQTVQSEVRLNLALNWVGGLPSR